MSSLLFFSGGTGPRALALLLAKLSINSVHIISTFDSGRSSRELRRVFAIPAPGDLRNRLLALADLKAAPRAALEFLYFRLPQRDVELNLREKLQSLGNPAHPVWQDFPEREKDLLFPNFSYILEKLPPDFNACNASLGNLVLAGAYLKNGRNFKTAIEIFASLVKAKGDVLPICGENLNLAAELDNGAILLGEDVFKFITKKICKFFLSVHEPYSSQSPDTFPCQPPLFAGAAEKIRDASAICFPMGSFYSSILANTLVKGVGTAIAKNSHAKVFIPNSGHDPENCYLDIADQIFLLLKNLKQDAANSHNNDLLNYVLIDKKNGVYPGKVDGSLLKRLAGMDVKPIFCQMVNKKNPNEHLPGPILEILLGLAKK